MRMLKLGGSTDARLLSSMPCRKQSEEPPVENEVRCQRGCHASSIEMRLPTWLESESQSEQTCVVQWN